MTPHCTKTSLSWHVNLPAFKGSGDFVSYGEAWVNPAVNINSTKAFFIQAPCSVTPPNNSVANVKAKAVSTVFVSYSWSGCEAICFHVILQQYCALSTQPCNLHTIARQTQNLTRYWFNFRPASAAPVQHWTGTVLDLWHLANSRQHTTWHWI